MSVPSAPLSFAQRLIYSARDEIDGLRDLQVAEDVLEQVGGIVPARHFHASEVLQPGVALTGGGDVLAVVELEHDGV